MCPVWPCRAAADHERRQLEEEEYGKPKVFPKEVPEAVTQPKFHQMLEENDKRRKMNHDARVKVCCMMSLVAVACGLSPLVVALSLSDVDGQSVGIPRSVGA